MKRNLRPNCECPRCGASFYCAPVVLRSRKSGRRFCSPACYRASQGTVAERFWTKVNKDGPIPAHCPELGPCWVWLAGSTSRGYGRFSIGSGRWVLAHRFAWTLGNGQIPEGLHVLHHCDTPACVRPDHLFLGTAADNHADMLTKGRETRGGRNNRSAKLTPEHVLDIRHLWETGGWSQYALAAHFGIGRTTVQRVVQRVHWKHL